ncbi:hypothetical protein [Haloarchaeobius sp. HRN-SO-5]|uniref:hypothetical protein n=1 Tax=Haloarchaeobius sp. HRN-SO-5 TaxID=3446118 RepID=UPI003EBA8332
MNWKDVGDGVDLPDAGEAITRRRALGAIGGLGGIGAAKAVDNVLLGYGIVEGTNLVDMDLAPVVGERLRPRPTGTSVGEYDLRIESGVAHLTGDGVDERVVLPGTTRADAAAIDDRLGVDLFEPLVVDDEALAPMVTANAADVEGVRFEFSTYEPFFERVRSGNARPSAVARLRENHYDRIEPVTVQRFSTADPTDPEAVVDGLVGAFRDYSNYDIPRYAAGSVEDNVLLGSVDLRQYFESPTSFEALEAGENSGLFCYEFVYRSIEALHAAPAFAQTTPVFAGYVHDRRHKHAYTAIGSVLREDGDLVVPMTFVDYTHSTLYDDLRLRGVMGRGLEAYNDRHYATDVYW